MAGKRGVWGSKDGVGLNATFGGPIGLTFDSTGDILVADYGNHLIRKIGLSSGIVMTIAGTGNQGWNGYGGPARSISLYSPIDICFDPTDSSFYFSDNGNQAIRRVNASGYLTTVIRNERLLIGPRGIVRRENLLVVSDRNPYIVRINL